MKLIALITYIIVQIAFLPLAIVGLILLTYHQLLISKKLGVSATAVSAIGSRWIMDLFDIRKDRESVALYRCLPNGSTIGLWLLFMPAYLRYRIGGKYNGYPFLSEPGKEGVLNVPAIRTIYFDKLIHGSVVEAEQFVVLGAGYDTRCYKFPKKKSNCRFFELDQTSTQRLKIKCLTKANLDTSAVEFVAVDFSSESWYKKLEQAGYDPGKRSLFLWEGVTIYLSENDVRQTLTDIRQHAGAGSRILMDVYAKSALALRGLKTTNENFVFGLEFSMDALSALKSFATSNHLQLGAYYFMGHKTKRGALGVVVELGV